MITKEQWKTIKAGDIVVSPSGRERKVLEHCMPSDMIKVYKINANGGSAVTYYTIHDIGRTYSIKPSAQNCRVKRTGQG